MEYFFFRSKKNPKEAICNFFVLFVNLGSNIHLSFFSNHFHFLIYIVHTTRRVFCSFIFMCTYMYVVDKLLVILGGIYVLEGYVVCPILFFSSSDRHRRQNNLSILSVLFVCIIEPLLEDFHFQSLVLIPEFFLYQIAFYYIYLFRHLHTSGKPFIQSASRGRFGSIRIDPCECIYI